MQMNANTITSGSPMMPSIRTTRSSSKWVLRWQKNCRKPWYRSALV